MAILALILFVVSAIVNFTCAVWVTIEMARERGPLHALLGFLCCTPAVFIWGWSQWDSEKKVHVMATWTFSILVSFGVPSLVDQSIFPGGARSPVYLYSPGSMPDDPGSSAPALFPGIEL